MPAYNSFPGQVEPLRYVRSQRRLFEDHRIKASLLAFISLICLGLFVYWNATTVRAIAARTNVWAETTPFLLLLLFYLSSARASLYLQGYRLKMASFALTGIVCLVLFISWSGTRRAYAFVSVYLFMVGFHYLMMRLFANRGQWFTLAVLSPIAALILVKYLSSMWDPAWKILNADGAFLSYFIGISYMAFRLSHLVMEVRNEVVEKPDFWEYLGFAFFIPTLAVGPINPYSVHHRSLSAAPDRSATPIGRSLLRMIIGLAKYQFLGNIFGQLSYTALMLDGHPHPPQDLFIAAVSFNLFLYFNFSGFCDMAIGAAGLLGIHVRENFKNPLAATSPQDYWNRWHITLSRYMRDMIFSPLSKGLVRRLGTQHANHAIALAILVVFLVLGAWHGVGLHYLVYGATQAAGVAAHHYYLVWLKKKLGRERFKAYNENRVLTTLSIAATFLYTTACLFVFANDFSTMGKILNTVH